MEKLKILNLNFSFQRAAHHHINGRDVADGGSLAGYVLRPPPWGYLCLLWNYEVHLQIGTQFLQS